MTKKKKNKPWGASKHKKPAPDHVTAAQENTEAAPDPTVPDFSILHSDKTSLLTVPEICALLKISRRTIERRKIPGKLKIGGSVRYHRQTIDQWLTEKIKAANPQARANASHERQSEA